MQQEENLGITIGRQGQVVEEETLWNLASITNRMIDFNLFYRGGAMLFPLYLFPEKEDAQKRSSGTTIMMVFDSKAEYGKTKRQPNIAPKIIENLEKAFGWKPTPEDILYYIYAVFYSDIYREKYAAFLKIDFPRVPFTRNPDLFKKMARLGKQLVGLHLLKSKDLDKTVAKYQGKGENDTIEKPIYRENEQRVYPE